MKKYILSALLLISGIIANAQKLKYANVPPEVKTSFDKSYPGQTAKWEKENDKFEGSFKQNGNDVSVLYEQNGTLAETEIGILTTELPVTALKYLKVHYPGKKIKEAAKTVMANGTITYEAEVGGTDVIFDESGKYLKEAKA